MIYAELHKDTLMNGQEMRFRPGSAPISPPDSPTKVASSSGKAKRRSSTSTSLSATSPKKTQAKSRKVTQPITSPKQKDRRLKYYRSNEQVAEDAIAIDARIKEITDQTKRGNHVVCTVMLWEPNEEGRISETVPIKKLQGTKVLQRWEARQIEANGEVWKNRTIMWL